jgi:hypothetical protein
VISNAIFSNIVSFADHPTNNNNNNNNNNHTLGKHNIL